MGINDTGPFVLPLFRISYIQTELMWASMQYVCYVMIVMLCVYACMQVLSVTANGWIKPKDTFQFCKIITPREKRKTCCKRGNASIDS